MVDQILTLKEVAAYLKLTDKTAYRLASEGKLPGFKVGGPGPDGRWRKFSYDEIIARDKTNLDISWLKDDSLEDTENLQPPAVIASEIVELLTAALEEFKSVEEALVDDEDEV